MISEEQFHSLLHKCRRLPSPGQPYFENDYVSNLLLIVLDFKMIGNAVARAMRYYHKNRRNAIGDYRGLKRLLSRHPDDKKGNICIGQYLWGRKYWSRVSWLRSLIDYLESVGVRSQEDLERHEETAGLTTNLNAKVPGLGSAVLKWFLTRQSVENVKLCTDVKRFVESVVGSSLTDPDLLMVLESIAEELNMKRYELLWRIWAYERSVKQKL